MNDKALYHRLQAIMSNIDRTDTCPACWGVSWEWVHTQDYNGTRECRLCLGTGRVYKQEETS